MKTYWVSKKWKHEIICIPTFKFYGCYLLWQNYIDRVDWTWNMEYLARHQKAIFKNYIPNLIPQEAVEFFSLKNKYARS